MYFVFFLILESIIKTGLYKFLDLFFSINFFDVKNVGLKALLDI